MIIKKYLANSLKDAEQLMRQELGSAAVILTTRQVKQKGLKRLFLSDQTELTATIERKDLEQFNAKKQKKEAPPLPKEAKKEARPMPREAKREEREELDDVVTLSASAKRQLSRPVEPALAPKKSAKREPVSSDPFGSASRNLISHFAEDLAHASEDKELQASIDEEVAHLAQLQELKDLKKLKQLEESEDLAELKDEADIDRLRHLIRAELKRAQESVSVGSLEQNEESLVGSVRFMMGKGIDRQIALDIERELEAAYPGVDMNAPSPERNARLNLLKEELAKRIRTSGPLILDRKEPTFVALVGPTGVGKTTAIVKLAHLHMKKGKKVGLISLDYTKVGAREQILQWATSLSLICKVATSIEDFLKASSEMRHLDLILIDTGGRNQYNWQQVDELGEWLHSLDQVEIMLALSATTKDVDAYGILKQFSPLRPKSLVITKTDETIALGSIVNVSSKFGYPISYLSSGSRLEDIQAADRFEIARKLLVLQNAPEYQHLRMLVSA